MESPIKKETVSALSIALATLVADSYTVYHDAHGYHWNVKGQDFAQYHELFAEIYDDIYGSIDPLAENMLKIQADAPFHMSELISLRTIAEGEPANDPQAMATDLLREIESLLATLKRAFDTATAQNEQGVANFIAERIDMTEKWAWQLRSSIGMQKAVLPAADQMILKQLQPFADATDAQWDIVVDEVTKAGGIRLTTGYAADILAKAAKAR